MINVRRIINEPIPSNCYLVYNRESGKCIIIDPGNQDSSELINQIDSLGLNPEFIILTHEHFDHCWGVNKLRIIYPEVKLVCNEICNQRIGDSKGNCSLFYDNSESFVISEADIIVNTMEETCMLGDEKIQIFQTPGHSDGGVTILIDNAVFTGDTIIPFLGTVTKLPTGSKEKLKKSIEIIDKLKGGGKILYPGHGDPVSLDNYDLSLALKASSIPEKNK